MEMKIHLIMSIDSIGDERVNDIEWVFCFLEGEIYTKICHWHFYLFIPPGQVPL